MNLNEIPTPETDAAKKNGASFSILCEDLERRLTVAREALAKLDSRLGGFCHGSWESGLCSIAQKALTQTAPKP